MPIRPARYADIPVMAYVLATSFGPDPLFQAMFPHQDEYPEDLVTAFRRSLRVAWWDYSKVMMISYDSEQNLLTEEAPWLLHDLERLSISRKGLTDIVTGFVEWQRNGVGQGQVWNMWSWDPRHLIKKFIEWRNKIAYFFRPCRASARPTTNDPDPLLYTNFVARLMPFTLHLLHNPLMPWRANHWSLEICCVHPYFQGRGYGKELVQWGLAKSKSDFAAGVTGLPSVVMSAPGKEAFYQKCGFREVLAITNATSTGEGVHPMLARGEPNAGSVLWSWVREDEQAASRDFEISV